MIRGGVASLKRNPFRGTSLPIPPCRTLKLGGLKVKIIADHLLSYPASLESGLNTPSPSVFALVKLLGTVPLPAGVCAVDDKP